MAKQSKYSLGGFNVIFVILFLGMVFLLAACEGGGGGGSSSKSTATTYSLFTDGTFAAGYQESYDVTGSMTGGVKYTGTFATETQSATTFNGAPAVPLKGTIALINTGSQNSLTLTGTEYFGTDASNLEYLGYHSELFGDTTSGTSLKEIPQSATIGDSGEAGTYTFSNGDIETVSWKLTKASGTYANLVLLTTITDSTGSMTLSNEEYTYTIDQDGNRHSVKIVLYIASYGITITLSGDKS